jgi:hypothetical protein
MFLLPIFHSSVPNCPSQIMFKKRAAACWRLTPVIPATQEAEIRKIEV